MARLLVVALFTAIVGVGVGLAWSQADTASQPGREDASPTREQAVGDPFADLAKAFDDAYNAHDADTIADLFAEKGELVIEEGTIIGRDAIRAAFADLFAEFPEATLRTEIDTIRLPSPQIAIEEGRTFASRASDLPAVEQPYVIVHARTGDKWEIARVREEPRKTVTPAEALQPLAWLVGDWIDESDDSTVETSCRWSEDGSWLLQDYHVHLRGGPAMTGTQRIGWDAAREEVRSWAFDSTGGFVEGVWSTDGTRWTVQVKGVAADGSIGSGTRRFSPLGPDAYLLQSFHRVLDGEPLPESEVTVVRRPPIVEAENPPVEGTVVPATSPDANDGPDSKSN